MSLRPILPIVLPDAVPAAVGEARPSFIEVAPCSLIVDDAYQRDLSERSRRLIRRIVEHWDWNRFKPPVATRVEGALHLIDGQHTAIAAATHGGIATIPVMLVATEDEASRAMAFVGHNRDRIAVSVNQVLYAELAAGDAEARAIADVCTKAGVTLLRLPPSKGAFKPGETMAVSTIRLLLRARGQESAGVVLATLARAECAPVSADLIRACDALLNAPEYTGLYAPAALCAAVASLNGRMPPETTTLAAAKKLPVWRALVITLANRRGRRNAALEPRPVSVTREFFGDPPPGRSALAQRRPA